MAWCVGKTSTIAFVVRLMLARGSRILLTSYTHSAVDNLLVKLVAKGLSPQVLGRVGSIATVRQSLHPYLLPGPPNLESGQRKVVASISQRVASLRVIGCTVLTAARHALLQTMKFDWCVTDESGQISQPASLGPLMLASKFLLVGDDYQLPPIVQSLEAAAKGMDISLFKCLGEAHPEAVVCLTSQYRMNDQVMALCNTLIYEHRLTCGNDGVAHARLHLPVPAALPVVRGRPGLFSWLGSALDPDHSVVFLSTDGVTPSQTPRHVSPMDDGMNESSYIDTRPVEPRLQWSESASDPSSSSNAVEVAVVQALVTHLRACGVDLSTVGVITPYRAQVRALLHALQRQCEISTSVSLPTSREDTQPVPELEDLSTVYEGPVVSTVDKFQGRDMDVIVISMVRSMHDKSVRDCSGECQCHWRLTPWVAGRRFVERLAKGQRFY